jgi:Ca2+-binding EF-hand superfamily protein
MLQRFSEIDTNKDGRIDEDDFALLLGVPSTGYTRDLFRLFDEEHSGFINFKEFITGLCLLSKNCPAKETIQLAFHTFDKNGNGKLTCADLSQMLRKCFRTITEEEIQSMFDHIDKNHDGYIDNGKVTYIESQ